MMAEFQPPGVGLFIFQISIIGVAEECSRTRVACSSFAGPSIPCCVHKGVFPDGWRNGTPHTGAVQLPTSLGISNEFPVASNRSEIAQVGKAADVACASRGVVLWIACCFAPKMVPNPLELSSGFPNVTRPIAGDEGWTATWRCQWGPQRDYVESTIDVFTAGVLMWL